MKVLLVFSILIVFIKCLPFFTYDQVLNQVKVSTPCKSSRGNSCQFKSSHVSSTRAHDFESVALNSNQLNAIQINPLYPSQLKSIQF